ncbi:EKC/KEOPS complex subunit BUD32 [Cryptococcus sp. DSM 104548]
MSASTVLLSSGQLIKQGAEAKVYLAPSLLPEPTIYWPPSSSSKPEPPQSDQDGVILKHRFAKTYRHPTLNASLTSTRLTFEARALNRAAKAGVVVPKVLWVDDKGGVIGMEKVEGWSVREVLGGGAEGEVEVAEDEPEEEVEGGLEQAKEAEEEFEGEEQNEGMVALRQLGVSQEHLMRSIGTALARLHKTTIIHGDLTTSNMMMRLTPNGPEPYEIVIIDFGLSSTAQFAESYAVDLYVLERAFASTHPKSGKLHAKVLEAYEEELGEKKWKPIGLKLKDVRLRGRKRDMTG